MITVTYEEVIVPRSGGMHHSGPHTITFATVEAYDIWKKSNEDIFEESEGEYITEVLKEEGV
jgi:hypothetical protein